MPYIYKTKKNHSERKTRKSSIRIKNPVQSVWEVILKIKTHTHTHQQYTIHCSSYRTTQTKTDTCIHIVYGCLTKSFVEKNKKQKNKSLRHASASLVITKKKERKK